MRVVCISSFLARPAARSYSALSSGRSPTTPSALLTLLFTVSPNFCQTAKPTTAMRQRMMMYSTVDRPRVSRRSWSTVFFSCFFMTGPPREWLRDRRCQHELCVAVSSDQRIPERCDGDRPDESDQAEEDHVLDVRDPSCVLVKGAVLHPIGLHHA